MVLNKFSETLKEKAAEATGLLSDLKEGGKEKLLDYVNGLAEILPIIAETGYKLKAFDIEISIPPGVNLQFEKVQDVPKEKIDSILEANKNREMLHLIVNSLVAADEFHKRIKVGNFTLTDISVDLSIPPNVHIKFVKK
jgi:hypothetical protein